jgi:hypothetical protein
VPNSGEWVPLWSARYGELSYATSSTSFTAAIDTQRTLPAPTIQLQDNRYDTLGVVFTGTLSTDTANKIVRARPSLSDDSGGIAGARLEATGTDYDTLSSGAPSPFSITEVERFNLQMEVDDSSVTGRIYSPSISIFGRIP